MGNSQSEEENEEEEYYEQYPPDPPVYYQPRNKRKPRKKQYYVPTQHNRRQTDTTPVSQVQHKSRSTSTISIPRQQKSQFSTLRTTSTTAIPATSQSASHGSSQSQDESELPHSASQNVGHSVNNYVIPAVESMEKKNLLDITPCQDGMLYQKLKICPQYNGQGCVTELCRRLHVCLYWATKTCYKKSCKCDHSIDNSVHNMRLLEACDEEADELPLDDSLGTSLMQEELQICLFSVLRKCTKESCSRVHSPKNYIWEVKDSKGWLRMSHNQSDYLELMYTHPSEECVDLIPIQAHIGNNKSLQRLANLISKETSWSVDFEAFKLNGTSSVHEIQRLSTVSDLTTRVPVATRWLWYWQDDDGCWESYREGAVKNVYHLSLTDYLEYSLRVKNRRFVTVKIGNYSYSIDGKEMSQTNTDTGKTRRVRRRPACSQVCRKSVKFDELFLTQPTTKKFLKLPVVSLSSEFLFIENLLKKTLVNLEIASIHRVQNDHLWKVYQNKKRLLVSLYNGDATAINEQYLFHGTNYQAVDYICAENLDWKLWGTNVGHKYGQGTYFSNMAKLAHLYGKSNRTGKKVMLVVLVLVGKSTVGHTNLSFPPMNKSAGRNYDTTCDKDTNPSIFVKYDRDEYYPAYVVRYSCGS